ncbi:MAG: hypothetical protein K6T85_02805 [Gorillibacterium sp.]|nr:hypothetical protein [Gorillibacterium sp.]
MVDLFDQLYPIACEAGVDAAGFWDMTYGEIVATIKAYEAQRLSAVQTQAYIAYQQAHVISAMISRVLGGKKSPPTIHQAFPNVFPVVEQKQQNWQIMKARMAAYADARKKWGEKHGADDRGTTDPDHNENNGA